MQRSNKHYAPQVVTTLELTESTEVAFYYDYFNGKVWANIRKFAKSHRYTGPTKHGVKFEPKHLPDIIRALEEADDRRDTMFDEVYARLPKNKSHDLVVHASIYRGTVGVDLRDWYRTPEGKEGWGKGIRLRVEYLSNLIDCLKLMNETKPNLKKLGSEAGLDSTLSHRRGTPSQLEGVPDNLRPLFAVEDDNDERQDN